jgi:transposase InsO family protein
VRAILLRHQLPPASERDSSSRRQFLRQQAATVLACDFLTVETIWLTRIYVLFFVSLERRRIEFIASTRNPEGHWIGQQARNLLMQLADRGQSFRFLLHDRDSTFSCGFDEIFRSEGITIVRTPIRASNANAYAERWVGTLRRECLDRILIVNRRHPERVLSIYTTITTGTGRTVLYPSNHPTTRPQHLAALRYGTSIDTSCAAASSTNTKRPREAHLRPTEFSNPTAHAAETGRGDAEARRAEDACGHESSVIESPARWVAHRRLRSGPRRGRPGAGGARTAGVATP